MIQATMEPIGEAFEREWPLERQTAWVREREAEGWSELRIARAARIHKRVVRRLLGRSRPPGRPKRHEHRPRLERVPAFRCAAGHRSIVRVTGLPRGHGRACLECLLTGVVAIDEHEWEAIFPGKERPLTLHDERGQHFVDRRPFVDAGWEQQVRDGAPPAGSSRFSVRRWRLGTAVRAAAEAQVAAARGDVTGLTAQEHRGQVARAEEAIWARLDRWSRAVASGAEPQQAAADEGLDPAWVEWAS